MSYTRICPLNKDEPEQPQSDSIFSKVLSGMKYVFNNQIKNNLKKPSEEVSKPKTCILNPFYIPPPVEEKGTDTNMETDQVLNKQSDDADTNISSNNETATQSSKNLPTEERSTGSESSHSIGVKKDSKLSSNISITVSESIKTDLTDVKVDEQKDSSENVKDIETEIVKCHKSKHTPKKKSRKKTKSKEGDDKQDSENEETSDLNDLTKSSLDKSGSSSDGTQNKPRIVLTFRSEKTGLRSTNVKIVTESEKQSEDIAGTSGRRSLRSKLSSPNFSESATEEIKKDLKRKSTNPPETEIQNSDDKSIKTTNSESDDSSKTPVSKRNKRANAPSDSNSEDSPPLNKEKEAVKRSARHRSREHSENVLANAIARKEKFYNEATPSGTTRLSRRIKPTAKVLANRELRIGFETQNNARLALVSEIPPPPLEECKVTRSRVKKTPEPKKISIMAKPKTSVEKVKIKKQKIFEPNTPEKAALETGQSDVKPVSNNLTVAEINRCILGPNQVELSIKCKRFDSSELKMEIDKGISHIYTTEELECRRLNRLKKKHLKKLGLKAVAEKPKKKSALPDREVVTDDSTMDSTNTEAIVEHLNIRSKSFDFGLLSQTETIEELHAEVAEEIKDVKETVELMTAAVIIEKIPDTKVEEVIEDKEIQFENQEVNQEENIDETAEENEDENLEESQDEVLDETPEDPIADVIPLDSYCDEEMREFDDIGTNDCSDEDYVPSEDERSHKKHRKRKASSSDLEDSLPIVQLKLYEKKKEKNIRVTRKRSKLDKSNRASTSTKDAESSSADEGGDTLALQQEFRKIVQTSCFCNNPSNVFLDLNALSDVEFCRAVDWVNGRALGCGRVANPDLPLVRAGSRAPYFLPCLMHRRRLTLHHCCASCGAFCTQGVFYQCNEGHLFHWECGLPFISLLVPQTQIDNMLCPPPPATDNLPQFDENGQPIPPLPPPKTCTLDVYNTNPGCPHCGLNEDTLEPLNTNCCKVNVEMKCLGPTLLLPNPRLQWTPARMSVHKNNNKKTVKVEVDQDTDKLIKELDVEVAIVPPEILPSMIENLNALKPAPIPTIVDYDELLIKTNKQVETGNMSNAICAKENSLEKMVAALSVGADPRKPHPDVDGGNCLHLAAREFNLCALHLFKSLGCHIDILDSKRRTPLMVAIISFDNRMKQIEKTKEPKGASKESDADKEDGKPLSKIEEAKVSLKKEFYATLKYLVKAGSDLSLKGPEGVTTLHLAAKNCDVAACSIMLEGYVEMSRNLINQKDDGGWTPLVWAAENNNVEVVRYLLKKGADPMICDSDKNIALHWAAVSGCSRSLESLLNAGCHVNVANIYGDTPLHVSARQDNYNCLVILLARGAKIDMKNLNGETAINCVDEESNCHSILAANSQLQTLAIHFNRAEQLVSNDISNGKEMNAIQCVNAVDDVDIVGGFTYITENCFTTDVTIDRKVTSLEPCTCAGRCGQSDSECACSSISIQSWYEPGGKLVPHFDYDDPPMIFECNELCSCNKTQCLNRSLSRGSKAILQVFRCGKEDLAGWGVRTMVNIYRGQLVSEYVGELLASDTAFSRRDDSYLFQLDVKENILEEDTEAYCLDARYYGNVSRFINHKCTPNIVPVRVFVNQRDLRFPRIAFFACRDIQAGDEIGFDYGDKFWSIKSKNIACQCGSKDCRYAGDQLQKMAIVKVKEEKVTKESAPNISIVDASTQNEGTNIKHESTMDIKQET